MTSTNVLDDLPEWVARAQAAQALAQQQEDALAAQKRRSAQQRPSAQQEEDLVAQKRPSAQQGLSQEASQQGQSGIFSGPSAPPRKPAAVRGVGLTPRLFEALQADETAYIEAVPADFVPAIGRHVQSVAPAEARPHIDPLLARGGGGNVMARYWCPVIVEDASSVRSVLHVDPLAVRKFRRYIAGELKGVQEKRRRMLRRIKNIRGELPPPKTRDAIARLNREVRNAEEKIDERLLRPLPPGTQTLHVLVEASASMLQLGLVCECLMKELPAVIEAAGVRRLTLTALGECRGAKTAPLESLECGNDPADALQAPIEWLTSLALGRQREGIVRAGPVGGFRLAGALRRASAAETLSGEGGGALIIVACSPPTDLEACIEHARRSELFLQVVGVLGASLEDPEPALQRLADAALPGSTMHLFFGSEYWRKFAGAQRRKLEMLELKRKEEEAAGLGGSHSDDDQHSDDGEIIDMKVYEMRLIERIMRECYVEEQCCAEELVCASRVLERTLVDRQEVLAAMRGRKLPAKAREKAAAGASL